MSEKGDSEFSIMMQRSEPDGAPNQGVSLLSFTMTSSSPTNNGHHPNLSSPSQNASKESSFSSDKSVSPIMTKSTLVSGTGQETEFGISRESSPLFRSRHAGGVDACMLQVEDEEAEVDGDVQGAIGTLESRIRPGEFVMRVLFAEFTSQAEKKIESVMLEPPVRQIIRDKALGYLNANCDINLGTFPVQIAATW